MENNDIFNNELTPPTTVDEAVNRLLIILNEPERMAIASAEEDELIEFHFGLGAAIRNAFALHNPSSELLLDCGTSIHPDDASLIIIKSLWKQLRNASKV